MGNFHFCFHQINYSGIVNGKGKLKGPEDITVFSSSFIGPIGLRLFSRHMFCPICLLAKVAIIVWDVSLNLWKLIKLDWPIKIIWSSGAIFLTSFGRSLRRRLGSLLSVLDTLGVWRRYKLNLLDSNFVSNISSWDSEIGHLLDESFFRLVNKDNGGLKEASHLARDLGSLD